MQLVIDLVTAVVAAFFGGLIAARLKQPVILGYLVAGVIVGPFTPGPVADQHTVEVLAEIGVAFLMFALGAELSLGELRRLGRVASIGGLVQILGTMLLGPLLAPLLDLSTVQGIFLGGLLALSSTVVALKVLMARGEMEAAHGRFALGLLVAQDLAVVPMVVVLPALASGSPTLAQDLGLAALKAAGVLVGAYLFGTRIIPYLLGRAATVGSRELFRLAVVGLALGTALVTQAAGLSLAFGAFLAGLVVAESEFRVQVVAEALPLRDVFASLFFVSVGMLINPTILVEQAGLMLVVTLATVLSKVAIVTVVGRWLGVGLGAALLAGLSIAQIGEFSFVLARVGVAAGAIPARVFDLTLAVALLSIVLTPSLVQIGPALAGWLERTGFGRSAAGEPAPADASAHGLSGHTVICGYGRVGRALGDALSEEGLPFIVIEENPQVVRALRERGIPSIYGDAAQAPVLEHAQVAMAEVVAVLIPDAYAAELTMRGVRVLRPDVDIVVRARDFDHLEELREAGASELVQPEFEAGVEVIRHTLRRYEIDETEIGRVADAQRARFYGENHGGA